MAVFRVERTQNYTVMSNHHLRNKRISLKAKGLLSQMLSLPDDWDYTLAGLASINLEGKGAIRAAIRELEEAGYVERNRVRDDKGCLRGTEYVIHEVPQVQTQFPEPSQSSPAPQPKSHAKAKASSTTHSQPHAEVSSCTQEQSLEPEPFFTPPTLEEPMLDFPTLENYTQLNKEENQRKNEIITDSISSLPFFSDDSAAQPPEGKGTEASVQRQNVQKDDAPKKGKKSAMKLEEMNTYREMIRENIGYDEFVMERPYDVGRLDEMVELMTETVCSTRKTIRVAGNDFPQVVVKSRLLKLNDEHIRFVFNCLQENTTKVRNMKQYLLAVLYNAPVTMQNSYDAQVRHDFYNGGE